MWGILISSKINSGGAAWIVLNAMAPFRALRTVYPRVARMAASKRRLSGVSSTTRILLGDPSARLLIMDAGGQITGENRRVYPSFVALALNLSPEQGGMLNPTPLLRRRGWGVRAELQKSDAPEQKPKVVQLRV
jgi:hypothetical protein